GGPGLPRAGRWLQSWARTRAREPCAHGQWSSVASPSALRPRAVDDVVHTRSPPIGEAHGHRGRRPGPSRGDELDGARPHLSGTGLPGVIGERQGSRLGAKDAHAVENPESAGEKAKVRDVPVESAK